MQENEEYGEVTPLQGIISQLDSMISDPKTITPESLQSIRDDLADMQGYVDGEETEQKPKKGGAEGIMISIGNMRKKEVEE
jgi:hypothetical protein